MAYQPPIKGRFLKKVPKREATPLELNKTLGNSVDGVVKLVGELTTLKQDVVEVVDSELAKIDEKIAQVDTTIKESETKIDAKIASFEKTAVGLIEEIHSIPAIQGLPGKDANEEGIAENVTKMVLAQLPSPEKIDKAALVKDVIAKIPENKASLKIIQEKFEVDPMSVIDKIMELAKDGKFKLKEENIDGLTQTMAAFRSQLGRGYLHGGGLSFANGVTGKDGSVIFIHPDGTLAQDNPNFFRNTWDATNRYGLNIGTVSGATNNWNLWIGEPKSTLDPDSYAGSGNNEFHSFETGTDTKNTTLLVEREIKSVSGSGGQTSIYTNTIASHSSGALQNLWGIGSDIDLVGAGNVTDARVIQGNVFVDGSGTITDAYIFYAGANSISGSITNLYGLYVNPQTAGANNWNIWSSPNVASFSAETQTNIFPATHQFGVIGSSAFPTAIQSITQGESPTSIFSYTNDTGNPITGNSTGAAATTSTVEFTGSGTVDYIASVQANAGIGNGSGTVTNGYLLWAQGYFGSGGITNAYGLKVEPVNAGTNNWNIWSGEPVANLSSRAAFDTIGVSNIFASINANTINQNGVASFISESNASDSTGFDAVNTFAIGNSNDATPVGGNGPLSLYVEADHQGTGTYDQIWGIDLQINNLSTGTINNAYGIQIQTAYNPSGTIVNNYGIKIEPQVTGTNSWGLWSGQSSISTDPYAVVPQSFNVFNSEYSTNKNNPQFGLTSFANLNDSITAGGIEGIFGAGTVTGSNNQNFAQGAEFDAYHHGTGTVDALLGVQGYTEVNNGGTVTDAYGFSAGGDTVSGAGSHIVNLHHLFVGDASAPTGGGVIDNLYGLHILPQTQGTNNWQLWSGDTTVVDPDNFLAGIPNVFSLNPITANAYNVGIFTNNITSGWQPGGLYIETVDSGSANSVGTIGLQIDNFHTSSGTGSGNQNQYLYFGNQGGRVSDNFAIYIEHVDGNNTTHPITNNYGIHVQPQDIGDNIYNIHTNQAAGTNYYAIYNAGTAQSYFGGKITTYNAIATKGFGIPAIVDVLALTNQSADITTTNFSNAGTAGLYRVNYSLEDTTSAIGTGSVTLTIAYTDDAGSTTTTATQVLTGTGRTSGTIFIQLASGNITYAISHTGIFSTAKYALYATCERLN